MHHAWCVGYAFQVLPGGAGTCNLYDTCETLNTVPDAEKGAEQLHEPKPPKPTKAQQSISDFIHGASPAPAASPRPVH